MIKVIIELQYEKQKNLKVKDYKNLAFDEIYNSGDTLDLSHCKIEDTEKDFLR